MAAPKLFLGQGGSTPAALYAAGESALDGGVAVNIKAVPVELIPAGVEGDCLFHTLYLAITHTMAVTLRITPIVDGISLDGIASGVTDERHTIVLTAKTKRTTVFHALGLSVPLLSDSSAEVGRFAMRGSRFTFDLSTTPQLADGELIIESQSVEVEVIEGSLVASIAETTPQ